MTDYKILPIEVARDDPFKEDRLKRENNIIFLTKLIAKIPGPFVLALDSPFGSGKTTFVRMLKAKLQNESHHCIYFDAWQNDYAIDPLVALVSAIEEEFGSLEEDFKKLEKHANKFVERMGVNVLRKTTGIDLDVEKKHFLPEENDCVKTFKEQQKALKAFRRGLKKLVETLVSGSESKVVVFVDELDRCKPPFAIQLLERIKHLFDIPNIIFVLSTDKGQLEECVKGIHGEGTNGAEYLRRFIDFEFALPDTSSKDNIAILLSRLGLYNTTLRYDIDTFVEYFALASELAELTIRAKEKSIALLRVAIENGTDIRNADLLALLIVLKAHNPPNFHRFVNGELPLEEAFPRLTSNLSTWLKVKPLAARICAWLVMADQRGISCCPLYKGNPQIEEEIDRHRNSILQKHQKEFLLSNGAISYIKRIASRIDLL